MNHRPRPAKIDTQRSSIEVFLDAKDAEIDAQSPRTPGLLFAEAARSATMRNSLVCCERFIRTVNGGNILDLKGYKVCLYAV